MSACGVYGHEHQGFSLAYICIGCPCPEQPGRPAPPPAPTLAESDTKRRSASRPRGVAVSNWPPFCSQDTDLRCPVCGEAHVQVRDKQMYYDGEEIEAYCAGCHAILEVQSTVTVEFSDPQVVDA